MIDIEIEWEKIQYEGDYYVLLTDVEVTIAEIVTEARKEFKRLKAE